MKISMVARGFPFFLRPGRTRFAPNDHINDGGRRPQLQIPERPL